MKKRSKRYKNLINPEKDKKIVALKEILDQVKKNSTTKFDESVDISLKINLKQSKGGDFSLRTVVNLPNGSGKKNKVAVLCEPDKVEEAKKSGADLVGSDDLIEKISVTDLCEKVPYYLRGVDFTNQMVSLITNHKIMWKIWENIYEMR